VEKKSKKWFIAIISFLLFFVLSGAFHVHATSVDYTEDYSNNYERLDSFHSDIYVHEDSTVKVVETIVYDTGGEQHHGIYRILPLVSATGRTMYISDISIVDENNNNYQYTQKKNTWGNKITWTIGDPDATFSGKKTYIITYTLQNALSRLKDIDEINWDVTGNGWPFPIDLISATIYLPQSITPLQSACYEGVFGEKDNYCNVMGGTGSVSFSSKGQLGLDEGMTVATGFSKGLITYQTRLDELKDTVKNLWYIPAIFIVTFLLTFLLLRKKIKAYFKRKQYYKNNTVVAEYEIDNFNPIDVAIITKGYVDGKGISAYIVWLAIQGYIKIIENEGEFSFEKVQGSDPQNQLDIDVIDDIAGKSENAFTPLDYVIFKKSVNEMAKSLITRDYIDINENYVFQINNLVVRIILPIFLAINPGVFIFLLSAQVGIIWSGSCLLIGLISFIFSGKNGVLTDKGLELERKFFGVKEYISVAEKDRIEFHNAPAKTPILFEKLLPFAMIFGLEKKWSKEFEDMYRDYGNPSWYSGASAFSTVSFVSNMSSVTSSINSSAPSSSSGGSGGGGSSGGGGGGGGGGSW